MNNPKNIRVLIAEDEYTVGKMIVMLLQQMSYTLVGEAADGIEAIEMACTLQPDVIMMDLNMPDMDGIEATQLIQERCPTPVVMLTAYEAQELVERASLAGVGAYLVKPPKAREIERAITIAMARFDDMMKLRAYADQLEQRVQERTAQLQAQHARLDAILNSTTDGIVVTDPHGQITQTNPVAQAWLNQTLAPDAAAQLRDAIHDLACSATKPQKIVLELTELDLELNRASIPGAEAGTLSGSVVALHDISHLKDLDRMKTTFIMNITHELSTPIATIQAYAYLLQRTSPENKRWAEHLNSLMHATHIQTQLSEDILQISRIYTGRVDIKPRPTDLNELVKDVITNQRALAQERGVLLTYTVADARPLAAIDPQQLMPVLNNLVADAIHYTPAGGTITVSIGLEATPERAWIAVADTGEEIQAADQPYVFERFFREWEPQSQRVSETGVRLMLVKGIVELHGGQVSVASATGGTTFTLWLPLVPDGSS